LLQWTGGRAGGHHSLEDFHQPILETYGAIRSQPNVVLVAGSGFGDAEGTLPYITGDWSKRFGRAPMPFDGILIGSRVMVAKEAATSQAAKELIVAAPGLDDSEWESCYADACGGIVTAVSEYGEKNHVLANRASLFAVEMYKTVFSQPRERHLPLLLARKAEIIGRINKDHVRPWFGKKPDGRVVDIEEMTYAEVAHRLVETMYVRHQSRWIHPSYRNLVFDFLQRIEHRFSKDTALYFVHSCALMDAAPFDFVSTVVFAYPASTTQLIGSEDVQCFINLCQRGNQKPVPFVPRMDENIYIWLMKDTTCQSEDLGAIVNQDAQRVYIQQGPVAARHSTKVNESIKGILDGIYHGQIAALLERYYGGDKSKVPVVECLGAEPVVCTLPSSVIVADSSSERVYYLPTDESLLPDHSTWITTICGTRKSWLHALLTAPLIIQGSKMVSNYVRKIMRPRTDQIVTVYGDDSGMSQSLKITSNSGLKELDVAINNGVIVLTIYQPSKTANHALSFHFEHHPLQAASPIHEIMEGRDDRIRYFYRVLWFTDYGRLERLRIYSDLPDVIEVNDVAITREWVSEYCRVIGNHSSNYPPNSERATLTPMDMLAVVSMNNIFKSLTSEYVHNGVLNLVHLFSHTCYADGAKLLKIGDTVSCKSVISELANTDVGKRIVIDIQIYREGVQIAVLQSSFLWRGVFIEDGVTYKSVTEPVSQVALMNIEDAKALETREWFVYREGSEGILQPGSVLEFHLKSDYRYSSKEIYSSIKTTGSVLLRSSTHKANRVADVSFESKVPAVEYLGAEPVVSTPPPSVIFADSSLERIYYLPTDEALLPDHDTWISAICGPRKSWLHALLTAPLIFQGSRAEDNYVRRMMRPRTGQIVTVYGDESGSVQSLEVTRNSGYKDLDLAISDRGIIVLNIYQPSGTTTHALNLQFVYHPSQPSSPIHEVMSGRDNRVRQFNTLLWAGNGKLLLQAPTFSMPGDTIEVNDVLVTNEWVSEYCSVIGNRSTNYMPNSERATLAPMDMLAIVSMGNIFKSISFGYIHDGVINLVHLFNHMQYADGARLLKIGDTVSCKSVISELTNTDSGKRIVINIQIYREGAQIAVLQSSFLWRGVFIEDGVTYKSVTEPVSQVALMNIEDAKALETREWFVYREGSEGILQPGSVLEFHLKSDYRYSSKEIYSSIKTTGSVLLRSSTHKANRVADVSFECGSSFGNPVTEYLARHGQPAERTAMFEGGGYEILPKSRSDRMVAVVPDTNWPYSHVSGDYNPIHTNRYVADMVGLPGTITHGLWTSASTRNWIEILAANNQPERVRSYHVNFQGMVVPKDRLETKVFHVGMKDGRILVKGQTFKAGGELVLDSISEIEQETTAYVFTGQGSQEARMGMDLYESSPVARVVWDRAEQHMLKVYGVSLFKVVRTNPTQLTVFFGGKLGAQIRSNYMALSKHRDNKAARLFPGIAEATGSFTFKSPGGLLNATQFTQPALVVLELAAVADLRSRSLVQKSAAFAGHSLGEYSALAAIGEAQGLLEIVNYNVKGSQYVVAGSLALLAAMGSVIDRVAEQGVDVTGEVGRAAIGGIAAEALASTGGAPLKRGHATVPLAGIDVPFHSTQLAPGAEPFREYLLSKIDPSSVDYSTLHNRYIPNLTGLPFEVSRDYFKLVHDLTESPVIGKKLQKWDDSLLDSPAEIAKLGYILLVELLAYQFASPVRWIETQSHLFNEMKTERLIEVGPSATLCGMAEKTHRLLESPMTHAASILHVVRDRADVYYEYDSTLSSDAEQEQEPEPAGGSQAAPALPAPQQSSPPPPSAAAPSNSPGAAIADTPLDAVNVIQTIVAHKLKRALEVVPVDRSIKELTGGKSTLQNEILGDLQKEISGRMPDKPEELPLREFASAIGSFSGTLGKHTSSHIARLFSAKMPGGFTQSVARNLLQTAYGLGPHRQDALLLAALTMEPASRLSSEAEAKAWVDSVAQAYAKSSGIVYTAASASGGGGSAVAVAKRIHAACKEALNLTPVYKELSVPTCPNTRVTNKGDIEYSETPRENELSFVEYVQHMKSPAFGDKPPFLHLRSILGESRRSYNEHLSQLYFNALKLMSTTGVSFAGKTALVTGCGRGSIGADILRGLLAGGARVVATTSSYSRKTTLFYEEMYREHGARGSELIVVPFNQGSTADTTALVEYIYSDASGSKGLGWDLDFVIPFAAIPEMGSTISGIDSHSELAHRIMLTNVLRLLGEIKDAKEHLGYVTRPSLVVLPLSPNHGNFGGDGMYGESKAGLEVILNCWKSETWAEYLSITGAVIGWTRGTGLMGGNNVIAHEVERLGVRTFSTREMAFNILGLLRPDISKLAETEPVWADFNGGFQWLSSSSSPVIGIRSSLNTTSDARKAAFVGYASEYDTLAGSHTGHLYSPPTYDPLANHIYRFPAVKSYEQLEHLRHLQGMVNLDKVVVVTGYGEVGPFGNAEHRWEMEAFGEFSLEGCIEVAWVMGLIKHHNGPLQKTGATYTGWVDAKSGEPVKDKHIKARYEKHILEHTGIRLIEPEMTDEYDPNKKLFMRELQIEHDMEPFEATADEAAAFKHQNGDRVDTWENKDGSWSVRFLKGAFILVPKALRFDRLVAAQIPTGWDPARYGIPEDTIKQVDIVTCYALVATVEALVRSGITDPYELYRYFHVSEIGNSIGSAIGGANKLHHAFRTRFLDGELQSDILQETFINTIAAWVNMLLLSSSGPIKTTVGACATSVLSVDIAVETIQSGKARMMLAGGVEGFIEESAYEFAQMGATSNSLEELASGRTPAEMCRPCTSTRNGFMEGEGAGIVTLMSASAAIEFGAPIYGIVAMSGTATDKQGSSVPAPGQGVLTSARETAASASPRLLDINYRRRQLDRQLAAINEWVSDELEELNSEADLGAKETITTEAERQRSVARDAWGNDFWRGNPHISPLRGCLAVWGLTVDDIGVASFHGTSTVANDKNESEVLNRQMEHLGRTPGLAVPAVCQKWLTGHSKGAAAAFMLNGVLQSLRTGIVPGNRNADNIAAELEKFEYIVYPSRSIQTPGIKAGLLKSFGFGQVGGEILVVHPDYLLAVLTHGQLDEYTEKLRQREAKSYRYWQDTLVGNHPFVQVKSAPPYTVDQEQQVYLDPLARAKYDSATKQCKF
ncbi:hypothetical protein GQ54DRAFT_321606, partial [Martensiomyces pterosporus]